MTVQGRLEHVDMGMGAWVIVTDDGARFQVDGEVSESLKGSRVIATGTRQAAHGFAMVDVDATLVLTAGLSKAD